MLWSPVSRVPRRLWRTAGSWKRVRGSMFPLSAVMRQAGKERKGWAPSCLVPSECWEYRGLEERRPSLGNLGTALYDKVSPPPLLPPTYYDPWWRRQTLPAQNVLFCGRLKRIHLTQGEPEIKILLWNECPGREAHCPNTRGLTRYLLAWRTPGFYITWLIVNGVLGLWVPDQVVRHEASSMPVVLNSEIPWVLSASVW